MLAASAAESKSNCLIRTWSLQLTLAVLSTLGIREVISPNRPIAIPNALTD